MVQHALVAYATKYGATAGIAEKIANVLREHGLEVTLRKVQEVGDPGAYTAVVLGSAVYIGQWRKEAASFLKTHEKTLAERPLWLFSSGPTGEGDPLELMRGWRFPQNLQPIAERIKPRDITVFHGALFGEKLSWLERWVVKNVKAPIGEYRSWDAITVWAEGIAAVLKQLEG